MEKLNELATKHFNWLAQMNWNNSTDLESAGMICSEIGESIVEVYENNLEKLSYELADIVLRTMGLTQRFGIDLEKSLSSQKVNWDTWAKMTSWEKKNNLEKLALMCAQAAPIINVCRQINVDDKKLAETSALLLSSVFKYQKKITSI